MGMADDRYRAVPTQVKTWTVEGPGLIGCAPIWDHEVDAARCALAMTRAYEAAVSGRADTARGEADLPALSAFLRQSGRDLAAVDPHKSASIIDWADVVDDMHTLVMYLVDAHRSGEVDEASACTVGESGGTPAARALQLLKLAMSRGAFSAPPRTVSEADAYQLVRIRNIVNEDARARHGDLPGDPSWGVVADSVLAHASQHRLAREILKVPKNRTLDQHVSLLRRADDLEADMLALRGAYLEAAGTNATLVELVGAVRRGADPEVERLRIEVQHYREMGCEEERRDR